MPHPIPFHPRLFLLLPGSQAVVRCLPRVRTSVARLVAWAGGQGKSTLEDNSFGGHRGCGRWRPTFSRCLMDCLGFSLFSLVDYDRSPVCSGIIPRLAQVRCLFFGNTGVICAPNAHLSGLNLVRTSGSCHIVLSLSPDPDSILQTLRTCNWKLLPLLLPLCADPCHLPPWHHQPGMHCHTPNRNASLLLEIHTDTRSPEGPWRSRGGLRLGAHESTGVPWLSGSTSSASPTVRSGPHTRKLHRPPGLTHYDIYAPGGNNQHSCLVRQTWVSVPASVSDTC